MATRTDDSSKARKRHLAVVNDVPAETVARPVGTQPRSIGRVIAQTALIADSAVRLSSDASEDNSRPTLSGRSWRARSLLGRLR